MLRKMGKSDLCQTCYMTARAVSPSCGVVTLYDIFLDVMVSVSFCDFMIGVL